MLIAKKPTNEVQRQTSLESFNILDTLPETEYDNITAIAAKICGTPIALISLVDNNRQWFKSKQGLGVDETPRDVAFCAHAILQPDKLFEVKDATKDQRFVDNPLVTGNPNVVFYAGSPLVTPDGEALGTLCVIDHQPREISQESKDLLSLLSHHVVTHMQVRKNNGVLFQLNEQLNQEIENRKNKEEQLKLAVAQAQQAERAKDQFLSNMSHEIRTPMNGIMGIAKLLLKESSLSEDHKDLVKHIDYSANHLLHIINDILDFSKLDSDKLIFEEINFDLSDLLKNIYHSLSVKSNEKNIEFDIRNDIRIPSTLCGDPYRLGQIILNLASNAIKFTNSGGVYIDCSLQSETESETIIAFKIKDTGIGIPADKVDYIFEQFTQSDSSVSREYGGTGLGLAISKKLVSQFGGEIKVISEIGKGSTFSFTVALGRAKKASVPAKIIEVLPSEVPSMLASDITILLAEDNKLNQIVATKHLKKYGFEIDVADNGKIAIDMLHKKKYDLILMDINMPVMDGIEATMQIRQLNIPQSSILIVAMTASVLAKDTKKCLAAGMDDFISKPFDPDKLNDKIISLVINQNTLQEN
ncbi:MAG: response regulator [Saprospiraceae bacterium]